MTRSTTTVRVLRLLLALLFTALLVAQLRALPALYDGWVRDAPELAASGWPVLAAGVLVLGCAQVVLCCTWRLLTLVSEGRIFSERAFSWVDTIVGAVGSAAVLLLALLLHLVLVLEVTVLPVVVLLALLGAAAVGLLVVVMRALLQQATALRTDLDAVI